MVEEVYNSTFKFHLLKNTRNMSHETLYCTSEYAKKCKKCVWWPGCALTRWRACRAPPDPLAELKGREGETGGERKGRGDGRGSEGEK